ncbi:MAG: o-succinylbenzoate synthase [Melioribacteraceae bacterium]|nr:o-succinylbenzoate synthase [Melioribacteraceae bacterium]MCF8354825.1 o-succinylbenzoate synthase [Melioribacteraceae bacterium]MCF8394544.1 o-succinylbenzoate synthase [Melioribacteraceae bacterium]MCF8420203.1 o-succinylbenzoate synthase [Melioribacteraceae bacterium]
MKVTGFKFFSKTLYFKNHFVSSKQTFDNRKIFILALKNEDGKYFYGEAAPLPGFGTESYEDVEKYLNRLSEMIIGRNLLSFSDVNTLNLESPTIHFAIEHAVFNNAVIEGNIQIPDIKIPVNALLDIKDPGQMTEQLSKLNSENFSVIKIKLGRKDFAEDLKILEQVSRYLRSNQKLRLDINGSWSFNKALQNIKQLSGYPIEYIEQPVSSLTELIKLADASPIPIAVDESIKTFHDAENIINNSRIDFLIIKPMLFGGINKTLQLVNLAESNNKFVIISSSLESPFAHLPLFYIASKIKHNLPHGLSTYNVFKNINYINVFNMQSGVVNISSKEYIDTLKTFSAQYDE